jgi:hypothetical protein
MLFERKFALSFVQGSGAIEWLWNSNSYMTESNETPIGAIRPDGTEKPEASVLRDMAKFAAAASPYMKNPKQPAIAVVTSQAAQFSAQGELQIAAQQNAVRALGYGLHQPCYVIAENQIDKLESPKLVILPSAQALRESTWQALLTYVKNGGNLLVTGPVSRDEHWHLVDRYTPLGIKASTAPLTFHYAVLVPDSIDSKGEHNLEAVIPLSFDQQRQQVLEYLRFSAGTTFLEAPVGRGKLFWAAFPLELSEGHGTTAQLYGAILGRANRPLVPATPGRVQIPVTFSVNVVVPQPVPKLAFPPQDILVYPVDLHDAILYALESESDQDANINLKDDASSAELEFRLPSQRAALALIDKNTKQVVAKYGF